jgi:hypothetical protein
MYSFSTSGCSGVFEFDFFLKPDTLLVDDATGIEGSISFC